MAAPYPPNEQIQPQITAGRHPLTRLWRVETTDGRELIATALVAEDTERTLELLPTGELRLPTSQILSVRRLWYVLGTDQLGRDVLSRILNGTRVTLEVGVLAALLALLLGVVVGTVSALGGRWIDELCMRAVDGLLAFPSLLLVVFVAAVFEPSTGLLIVVIGASTWMGLSRIVRAEILVLERRPFVEAARAIGVGPWRLVWHHLLPNAAPPILVAASLGVAEAILMESAVSFLGLGVGADLPSWGRLVADGSGDLATWWWISTFPGCAIIATVFAFNRFSDRLQLAFGGRG